MVHRSARYIAIGSSARSPIGNAVVGVVGETSTSTCCEGRLEVARDERADLLGLAVVGVVVAARQGVRAEHDAALDLGAETGRAGQRHDLLGAAGAVVADPQAVAHGVEAGQVGRALATARSGSTPAARRSKDGQDTSTTFGAERLAAARRPR